MRRSEGRGGGSRGARTMGRGPAAASHRAGTGPGSGVGRGGGSPESPLCPLAGEDGPAAIPVADGPARPGPGVP